MNTNDRIFLLGLYALVYLMVLLEIVLYSDSSESVHYVMF